MRSIEFYRTKTGSCPIEEFLENLPDKHVKKIAWVLRIVRDLPSVPKNYFKKLVDTEDIWEVRVSSGNNIFRLLGFFHGNSLIILTNGFVKKQRRTPRKEIDIAEKRKKDYLKRS